MIRVRWFICGLALLAGLASVGALAAGTAQALTCDTWQGGSSGSWSTSSNWSSGTPTSTTLACIPTGDTVTVSGSGNTAAAVQGSSGTPGSLDITGTLTIEGTTGSSIEDLTVDVGTLDGGPSATDITVGGDTDITSVNGQGTSTIGSTVAITQTGTGTLTVGGSNAEGESVDGSIDDQSTGSVTVDPTMYLESSFTSTEPISMATGTYTGAGSPSITAPSISIGGAVTINVPIELTDGTTSLTNILTITGAGLTLDHTATLDTGSSGDGIEFGTSSASKIDGTVSGAGTFETSAEGGTVTLESDCTYDLTALDVQAGILTDDLLSLPNITSITVDGGQLVLSSGESITDSGDLTMNGGDLTLSSGSATLGVGGNVDITSGSGNTATIDGGIAITQTGTGTLTVGSSTAQEELLSGSFDDQSTGSVSVYPSMYLESTFTSTEPITMAAGEYDGAGAPSINAPSISIGGPVTIEVPIELTDGTTTLGAPLTISGQLELDHAATLNTGSSSDGISFTENGTSTIDGTVTGSGPVGANTYGGVTIESDSTFVTPPSVTAQDCGSITDDLATFTVAELQLTSCGKFYVGAGGSVRDNGDFVLNTATISGASSSSPATLTVGGNFTITSVNGQGTATFGPNITATQNGSGTFAIGTGSGTEGEVLDDQITTNTTDAADGAVAIGSTLGGNPTGDVISTHEPIDFTASGLNAGANGFQAPYFVFGASDESLTVGSLTQTGPGTTDVTSGTTIDTAGTVGGSFGTINVQGGTFTIDGSVQAQVDVTDGGTLEGTGTIDGDGYGQSTAVDNISGTVLPGDAGVGTLDLTGSYEQGSAGTLAVPISGTGAGDYSVLSVGGSNADATLAGTVQLQPTNAYAASANTGDTFGVLTYTGSLTGSFGTVTSQPPLHLGEPVTESNDTTDKVVDLVVGSPSPPQNSVAPSITGTALPGDTLTCHSGTWTESPAFTYQWERNGTAITGATSASYTVQIADEGTTLTCEVTATADSEQAMATATGVLVAIKGTLTCPRPTGSISGTTLGLWHLGMTQAQARKVSKFYTVTKYGFDRFCMYAGWGVRTGYASKLLVSGLPKSQGKALLGKVVMILAANTHYILDGIKPGTAFTAIPHSVKLSKPFKIGLNTWYLIPGAKATGVLKVADGVAQEVGIANKQLTTGTTASQRRFLSTFGQS